MSRGILDEADSERIYPETPDLKELGNMILSLSPDFLSMSFPRDSNIPIASACFQDTFYTLQEASHALSEIFAHQIWYLEKKDTPDEWLAAFFSRFYADDVALRLYSAAEHLANGIIMMLEITDKDLEPYKVKRSSQRVIVGNYLCNKKMNHPVTKSAIKLNDSKQWCDTINYRNRLVHDQPPTVKGLGIVYERRRRWKQVSNGQFTLGIGGGDKPEYSVKDLVGFIKPALFQFSDTLISVVEFYKKLINDQPTP